jgi:branched-subunit amino acid aminotransferase/4-amino-4-deoxychorismate lyase
VKLLEGITSDFFSGEALYETLLVSHGRVAFGPEHFARLRASCAELGFPPPPPDAEVLENLRSFLAPPKPYHDMDVRLNLRRDHESFWIAAREVGPEIAVARRDGAPAIVFRLPDDRRDRARHKWVERRTLNLAMSAAREAGAHEALLFAPDGSLLEGATSNVFAVFAGRLRTPPTDARILPGVTRSALCAIASEIGLTLDEAPIDEEMLRAADEVFLTSAVRMLVPVIAIDGDQVGSGESGEVARDLARRLWAKAFGADD